MYNRRGAPYVETMKFEGPALLALDIDAPRALTMDEHARNLLEDTSHIDGIMVVAMTDGDAGEAALRLHGAGVYVIGDGGLEIRDTEGRVLREVRPLQKFVDVQLRREIAACGMQLEQRRHSIRLEWQGVPYRAIAPVVDAFRAWARGSGLELVEGAGVVVARAQSRGKQEALQWLARTVGAARLIDAAEHVEMPPPVWPRSVPEEVMV